MIPKAAFPPPRITHLAPILPNAFLYPSFLLLLLARKNPGNLSRPRNSSRLPGLILSSQACEISIPFLYRPDFSKSSLFLPSLVRTSSFCLLTQNRYGVPFPSLRLHRRRTACRPPRFFLFPFPASAGSQVDGKWPFFASQVPVCSLFTPALRRNAAPFVLFLAQNASASPTAPCSLPKLPIPFSPLGNRFILLQNRSFFFFLRQNYEKLSGFN